MSNTDRLKEIKEKFNLGKDDFWEMKRGGKSIWILTHDACEKIAYQEGIVFHMPDPKLSNTEPPNIVLYGSATLKDRTEWSNGEANPTNCKMPYMNAMAEKRLKDRLTLKLINAYEYQIYSEIEADAFEKPIEVKKAPKPVSEKQQTLIMSLEPQADVKTFIDFEGLTMDSASKYIDKLNNIIEGKKNEQNNQHQARRN
mgnify:CR=1 FL=1|tara:strand:- start:5208 stop:5804 length:597 start_codon:yes stop_codon:yes gene_type:complete